MKVSVLVFGTKMRVQSPTASLAGEMTTRGQRPFNTIRSRTRVFTVGEVAAALRMHPNTVRNWSRNGLIESSRIGRRGDRRFSREDIQNFLNHRDRNGQSANSYRPEVLIVDDERRIRSLLKDIVEEQGCEAVSVESGERALEELEKRDFHLIFLDLVLPGLDGVEVLRRIKAKGTSAVVAVITGCGDEPIALEALSLGPSVLLRKPLNLADVVGTVGLALGARRYPGNSS